MLQRPASRSSLDKDAKPDAVCDECTDDRKGKPIVGLEIIRGGKKAEGKDVWEGGKILDPENGKDYTLRLTPIDGGKKLEVRGYIGAVLGRTQTWIRVAVKRTSQPATVTMEATMSRFQVKKVAVLGAGVMGAQIAAHLVNVQGAGRAVRPARQGRPEERHRHARPSTDLKKLKPAPLGVRRDAALIEQANYEEHLEHAAANATW